MFTVQFRNRALRNNNVRNNRTLRFYGKRYSLTFSWTEKFISSTVETTKGRYLTVAMCLIPSLKTSLTNRGRFSAVETNDNELSSSMNNKWYFVTFFL